MFIKVFKVKRPILWYSDRVGDTFEVMTGVDTRIDYPGDGYIVVVNGRGIDMYIFKEDCIDIVKVREEKLNQLLPETNTKSL